MKILRSTKLTLNFANDGKIERLQAILAEYSKVVNFFIDLFWETPTQKRELLKGIIHRADTWLFARTIKVAAREAIDLIKAAKRSAEETKRPLVKPTHYGNRMCFLSTNARLEPPKRTTEFNGWLHLYSIGEGILLDLPVRGHKHLNKLKALGTMLQSFIITPTYVQICYKIETGPKLAEGDVSGLDTGINALATLDTGEQYGTKVKEKIERVKRCEYGSKGQKRARNALKQYIDEAAKQVVDGKQLVVVEKLHQLNYKTKLKRRLRKSMRRSLGAWNYRYWLKRVQAACELGRSKFASVAPQYTSQRCYACGHTERANRNGEVFKCKKCAYACNADVNAAKNILLRFVTGPYGAGYEPENLCLPA
jgi:IS605 OrfB family transposase